MADSSQNTSSATKEITQYLNVKNAKIVALLMVITFIIYHGSLHFKYGSDSCKWLMSDGRFPGRDRWQPYGCMMHKYSKMDARTCMHYVSYWGGHNHFAFVGDSRIRQLYLEMVQLMSESPPLEMEVKKHEDMTFTDNKINIKLEFLWSPMVDASMYDRYKKWLKSDQPGARPNLLITGSATHAIKTYNASSEALKNFQANLTLIEKKFREIKESTKVVWMLQDPVDEEKLHPVRRMITNEQVDKYNKVAITVLKDSPVTVWSSSRLVAQGYKKDLTIDGLHIQKPALEIYIQMLMNLYCNNDMNHHDGTCCNTPESATTLQIITAIGFLICMGIAVGLVLYRRKVPRNGNKARAENSTRNVHIAPHQKDYNEAFYEIITNVAKLGLIMAYFYLCDRTSFFMKENKYYTHLNFFLPFAYVMILGFFFTESTDKMNVLHRDQTDEWKGWMQLVILIYHLTGASQVLPIYMHIRVLVSSYLFLTGYNHFSYYWEKGQFGFGRYCLGWRHCQIAWRSRDSHGRNVLGVLFRLNLLVVTLCFVMNRPYQFYYWSPLVSFWYLVIYLLMAIPPHVSRESSEAHPLHYLYMILKFVALIVVISLFYLSEVFFEKVFLVRPLKALFVTSDDSLHEWRFRWQLDRFSAVYGMLFAFGYKVMKRYRLIKDDGPENLISNPLAWILCVCSVIGIASYTIFSVLCGNKYICNDIHSYLVFLPIISYLLLRNIPGALRSRYSSFFAWFGRISLELFICQYHIWMAADTHGVLVLIPSYPVLNVVITSFIFIVAAHEVHEISRVLVSYFVPHEMRLLVRNLILFIAILIPLCYVNGLLGL